MKRTLILATALIMATIAYGYIDNANANEAFGVGVVPANPRPDNPRTKSIFVHTAEPGEQIEETVRIINRTNTEKEVTIYGVDSQLASDGAFACAQAADEPKSVGQWFEFDENRLTLEPNETREVDFVINIPDQTEVGEHNGCLVIQDADRQSVDDRGIVLSFRSALRTAVTIPGDIDAALDFVDVEQKYKDDETLVISPSFRNIGNVSLDSDIAVTLRNIFGGVSSEAGGQFPILAGAESKFNFEVDRPFWGGFYWRVIGAEYVQLTQQSEDSDFTAIDNNSQLVFIKPHPTALIIEIVAFAIIVTALSISIYRRRRHQQLTQSTTTYTVKQNDDIQSIAKKHHISWKVLAKINHLKAPYTFKKGDEIHVPSKKNQKTKKTGSSKSSKKNFKTKIK